MALRIRLAILVLWMAGLACQAGGRLLQTQDLPAAGPAAQLISTATLRPLTPTPTPTRTTAPTAAPSATRTAAPTATATPTATAPPGDAALQQRVFEALWQAVQQDYLYPDYNGLDWEQVFNEYSRLIEGSLSDQAFYLAMEEMITRLGDDHSVFMGPTDALDEDAEYAGENDFVGIGVLTRFVPERNRLTIIVVFPDSPAEQAGIQPHDSILAVDGIAISGENGMRRDMLRGPEGTPLTLTIQSPNQQPRQVSVTRARVTGSVPLDSKLLATLQGRRVGYILLPTFSDETIDDRFKTALADFLSVHSVEGLVLDIRQNPGGADTVARTMLGYFIKGNVGYFIDRDQRKRAFNILGANIQGSASLPVVVLVGSNTASFGEIFAGVLKDSGRAYIIGEPTHGNIEVLWRYDFEDGSRAWIARETFRSLQNPDQDWELTGILPDQIVPSNWDEHTLDSDPAVKAALLYLDSLD